MQIKEHSGVIDTIRVGLLLMTLVMGHQVSAYPRMIFSEDSAQTPEQAQRFRGEAQLAGEVSDSGFALYRWALDDSETDRLWSLELHGPPGARAEFFWPEEAPQEPAVATFGEVGGFSDATAGKAAAETALLSLSVSSRNAPALAEALMVPPGEHLIRVQTDRDPGAYRLLLTTDDSINIRSTVQPDGGDVVVSPGRRWFFQVNVPEVVIPLETSAEPMQMWRLALLGELGVALDARIEDAAGAVLIDSIAGNPLQWQQGRWSYRKAALYTCAIPEGNPSAGSR